MTKEELKNELELAMKAHFGGGKGQSLSYAEVDNVLEIILKYILYSHTVVPKAAKKMNNWKEDFS